MGKTIGVIAIKGGVGKTSVVSSLGYSLANDFGKKVLVVDANFSAPNLALHLGLVDPEVSIHDVIHKDMDVFNSIYETEYGFDLIPGALIHRQVKPAKLKSALKKLKGEYDFILIDSSPSLNEELIAAMMASDELFVVSTPDHVTLNTTLRATRIAKQRGTPINGIILNKVYNKEFELNLDEIEEASDTNILAVLPHEVNVLKSLSQHVPSSSNKKVETSYEYRKLAAAICGEEFKDRRFKKMVKSMFSRDLSKLEMNRTIYRDSRFEN